MLFRSKKKCFRFFPYPGTTSLYRLSWIDLHGLNHRFLFPLIGLLTRTLYIWCAILYCCYWALSLSPFLTVSWVMAGQSAWLPRTNSNVQNYEIIEMPIFWFLRRKLQLSSQAIIGNNMLFTFRNKCFRFLSCAETSYLCKHHVRFLSIDPPRLDHWFLIPLTLPS
jgi:hypothetical protein